MPVLVADTSGLVSLGIAAGGSPDPLAICFDAYEVLIPETVFQELREVASYDDEHGQAADTVISRIDDVTTQSVTLDPGFPLDDGENAAVTLANDVDAELLLCDEFTRIGLVHASLSETRLATTPTLLAVLVRRGKLTRTEARRALDVIGTARSWEGNSYVERARDLLE
ncbi:MAG: hypothetical protein ABEH66_03615 [Halobacteriales archaeon]